MRLAAPEAKTAEPRSSTFSPRCSACTMLPNTVSTMVSVSVFARPVTRATSSTSAAFVRLSVSRHARAVRLRDLRHGTCQNLLVDLQRVWQPASSLMTGRPVTEGAFARRLSGASRRASAGPARSTVASKRSARSGRPRRPAASNERGVAKALPERRLVGRASRSALTVLYDQPAGAARVRNQVPSPGRSVSPTAAGPVPQLDGLALAQVPSVNGSVPCLIRTVSSVPATVLVASGPCPRLGSRRGEAALHQTMGRGPRTMRRWQPPTHARTRGRGSCGKAIDASGPQARP